MLWGWGNANLALLKQLKESGDSLENLNEKIDNLTDAVNGINAKIFSTYRSGARDYILSIERNSLTLIGCQHDGNTNHLVAILVGGIVHNLIESGNVFSVTWMGANTFKIKSTAPYYVIGIISTNEFTFSDS